MHAVYVQYIAAHVRQKVRDWVLSVKRLNFWWDIFYSFGIAFSLAALLLKDAAYVLAVIAAFAVLSVLSLYSHYKSGRHIHWYRQQHGYDVGEKHGKKDRKDNFQQQAA